MCEIQSVQPYLYSTYLKYLYVKIRYSKNGGNFQDDLIIQRTRGLDISTVDLATIIIHLETCRIRFYYDHSTMTSRRIEFPNITNALILDHQRCSDPSSNFSRIRSFSTSAYLWSSNFPKITDDSILDASIVKPSRYFCKVSIFDRKIFPRLSTLRSSNHPKTIGIFNSRIFS